MKFKQIVLVLLAIFIVQFVSAADANISSIGRDSIPKFNNPIYVIYGDTRSDYDAHRRVIKAIERVNPVYVFHTGDFIRGSEVEEQWEIFDEITSHLRKTAKFFPVIGNHEADHEDSFFARFPYLHGEHWYSVDDNKLHFIILDSNSETREDCAQYNWLQNDLENIPADNKFIIVLVHHPLFTTGPHPDDEKGLRETFMPLFEEYGVDVVFSGHNHSYERSFNNGIYYIVSAGGGAPLYEQARSSEYSQLYLAEYNFCKLFRFGDKLIIDVLNPQLELLDEIIIEENTH
ncbi:MAG: hypothetical protein DRZ79_03360 [Candidatus Cloacimonadota bacterium]|nr:MAG: hypothetical protein DRZ79_03360 [Candidatus Cloacimonadota bacterium]